MCLVGGSNKTIDVDFATTLKADKLAIKEALVPIVSELSSKVTKKNIHQTTLHITKAIINQVREHFRTKYKWKLEKCLLIGEKEIQDIAGEDMFDIETYEYRNFQ
jgi:hypothetical protein